MELLKLNFKSFYVLRPAMIRSTDRSKFHNFGMKVADVILYPIFILFYPKGVITSNQIGKSMLKIALEGYDKQILENVDIRRSNELARGV